MADDARAVRVGFLGAGAWGRRKHLPALAALASTGRARVEALCERDSGVREAVAGEYGIDRTYAELEPFAEDEELDCYAVVIDPHRLPEVLPRLARRGVPILTEKPPGASAAAAEALAAEVKVANVVGFNRRYFPIVERFKTLLDATEGVYHVSCLFSRHERYDSKLHRDSGGRRGVPYMTGTGIHAINTLEYLFGEIRSWEVRVRDVPGRGHPYWVALLSFAGGAEGELTVMSLSGTSTERIEAQSPDRGLEISYSMYSPSDYPGRIRVYEKGEAARVIEGDASAARLVNEGFMGEYGDLMDLARGGRQLAPRSTLTSSVSSMRVAEALEAAW